MEINFKRHTEELIKVVNLQIFVQESQEKPTYVNGKEQY
jgi:hypothetical protein